MKAWRLVAATLLAFGGLLAIALATWVAVYTRFEYTTTSGRHALRRVTPVSLLAWLLFVGAFAVIDRARRDRLLASLGAFVARRGSLLAAVLSLGVVGTAVANGAFTAAGADLYGYVSQSRLWLAGTPVQPLPALAFESGFDPFVFCPLGYRPGAMEGTMVPSYAAGLPLQMTVLEKVGGRDAGYLVVPVLAGLTVWIAFVMARRVMPAGAAVVAACCVAASPVLLVQMMQPMSDVPATAWWVAAAAALTVDSPAAAVTAGLAASLAIMTRPNLVPLALPVVAFLFVGETAGRRVLRRAFWFAAGCVPGVALVAATNAIFYGSPLTSGYGSLGAIYHGGGAATTIATYLRWLWDTHSVLVFLPLVAVVYRILGGRRVTRETAAFCGAALGVMAVNIGCYAFYERYDHWTYLRFLLPGLPLLIVGGLGAVSDVCAGATLRSRVMVLGFIVLMFPFAFVHTAARADAFRLKPEFRHTYQDAAAFADAHLPSDAAFIAVGQSGSLRLYGNRLTLRLDTLAPPDADPFVSYLERQHYAPYAALNRDEVSLFLTRYAGTGVGRAAMLRTHVALPPDGAVVFFPLGGTAK